MTGCSRTWSSSGRSKVRPAGQLRPCSNFIHPAYRLLMAQIGFSCAYQALGALENWSTPWGEWEKYTDIHSIYFEGQVEEASSMRWGPCPRAVNHDCRGTRKSNQEQILGLNCPTSNKEIWVFLSFDGLINRACQLLIAIAYNSNILLYVISIIFLKFKRKTAKS